MFHNKNSFIDIMEKIINELDNKNKKYILHKKYSIKDYICGIIEVISNNISWRKYNGKINGRVLNNKHNYYIKIGVYEKLFKTNLLRKTSRKKGTNKKNLNELSLDSSFIPNKYGTEKIRRNIYYKNKNGRKITAIVDKKGIPKEVNITKGNKHDAKIAPKMINKIPINESKTEKYIMADRAYDSKRIREIIKLRGYKSIIPRRKYKNTRRKSLKKSEKNRYSR